MIYIIAQNFQQAKAYAAKRNIRPKDFRYIAKPDDLLGLPGKSKVVKTGTWQKHRHIFDIMIIAERKQFTVTEEVI